MWDEIAAEVAKDFPEVKVDKMLVDAMTCRMVLDPKSLDTIVATNLVSNGHIQFINTPLTGCSMQTFYPTSQPHSQAPLASHRQVTVSHPFP
jgi:hypothetical protein